MSQVGKQKLTLTEIMQRPTPPIDAETQEIIEAMETLFPEKTPEPYTPNESRLSKEIREWTETYL